jgi:alpha-tubulin suppressor-like RCC1 family protein
VVPAVVPGGLTFLTVSAGLTHACGVTVDGSAFCWGSNGDGQMGNGTTTPSDAPVAVSGNLSFATVTTGEHHSCGVTSGGAAFCWGRNSSGQLGTGSTVPSNVPVAVVGGQRFAVLSTADADELGGHHTCGVTTDHAAYCWGSNGGGELGDGTTGLPHNAPVAVVGGLNFVTISARGAYSIGYTCGVTTTGGGHCWGSGPLGTDATVVRTTSATPAPVLGQLTFVTISAGAAQGGHTCGATSDGATYCWGGNFYGELGNGGTVPSPVPVPVMFP